MDEENIDDNISSQHDGVIDNPDDLSPSSENPLQVATTVANSNNGS